MATFDHDSVTIDRMHFETLVRRANINSDPSNDTIPKTTLPDAAIFLSRADYENLLHAAQQYANLTRNLLRGGVVEETIALLSRDDSAIQNEYQPSKAVGDDNSAGSDWGLDSGGIRICQPSSTFQNAPLNRRFPGNSSEADFVCGHNYIHGHSHIYADGGSGGPHIMRDRSQNTFSWNDDGNEVLDADVSKAPPAQGVQDQGHGQFGTAGVPKLGPVLERACRRTLRIPNIPDGATHANLAAVIRGGPLLEIYIRKHDRSAMVSFFYAADATAFFDHVQKYGLYVRQKRLSVCWAERQFVLPGHVANKIANGATRNLVIRRCSSLITEKMIREDLDHIHNIVVLKVEFIGGSCYISTNSVHNALFARTCMISRLKFKGSKIEWYPDECAQPLQHAHPISKPKKAAATAKKPSMPKVANRFQLLNLDPGDDENSKHDDDDEDTETGDAASDLLVENYAIAANF